MTHGASNRYIQLSTSQGLIQMRDYLMIGSTPADEPCVQIEHPDARKLTRIEITAFSEQIKRALPDLAYDLIELRIKWEQHDFGTYGELAVYYDTDNKASVDAAYTIESDAPLEWDEEALQFLKDRNYPYQEIKDVFSPHEAMKSWMQRNDINVDQD